jgi:hypothetical protein
VSSSDSQKISVCRISDHALLAIFDAWTNAATPVERGAAWTSTDGRNWRSVTLPAGITADDVQSDGQRALVVLPVGDGSKESPLSLQTFDNNYALVTVTQSGSQPSIAATDSPMSDGYGLVAMGPSGVVVTDGHQLWMGTPSAG